MTYQTSRIEDELCGDQFHLLMQRAKRFDAAPTSPKQDRMPITQLRSIVTNGNAGGLFALLPNDLLGTTIIAMLCVLLVI